MEFHGDTLDDLMHEALKAVLASGHSVPGAKRGPCTELIGVSLHLANPLARLSKTLARGKWISCIGELAWYLSGSDDSDFITHYISRYASELENGKLISAYGPRLFGPTTGQVPIIISKLRAHTPTRKAVISLFPPSDLHLEYPSCTCTLQFLARDNRLHLCVSMRSNDAVKGLTHDVFAFTMLQELIASSLDLRLGTYHHFVGSFHIYDDTQAQVQSFLDEGYYSADPIMPQMPAASLANEVPAFLSAEAALRAGRRQVEYENTAHPYWSDLVRLLTLHAIRKNKIPADAEAVLASLAHAEYRRFYLADRHSPPKP